MKAERFYGASDGPDMVIDRASDGAPLVDYCGWTCGNCDTLFACRGAAERCCVAPSLVVGGSMEVK